MTDQSADQKAACMNADMTGYAENELEIYSYEGDGYKPMISFGDWRVAFLRHADRFDKNRVEKMERHMLTDEVFVLLFGEAFLILGEDEKVVRMKKNMLYNVKKAVWHAVCVSEDAQVLIVENDNTGAQNTEYRKLRSEVSA